MKASTLSPRRAEAMAEVLADVSWGDLHSVERTVTALPQGRVAHAVQDWIVTRLDVLNGDLPAHAQVRAGLLTVAGSTVVVLAYRPTSLSRPRVWVAAVPEVAR